MAEDKLQLQRFELKYWVREDVAKAVREFVRSYLELDEFGDEEHGSYSYPVHSLYLDSDRLGLYWDTINGLKNRYKLRLRYYDERPDSPVFFEIKRRMNEAILKQRGAVRRDAVPWILAGHLPEPEHLLSKDSRQLVAIQRFSQLMLERRVKPKAHVAYQREAWISPHDNSVRVTMDRNVLFEPEPNARFRCSFENPVCVFGKTVILELKFTGRFPNWFGDLVRVFGLRQGAAAKYADGIALVGESKLSRPSMTELLPEPPRQSPKRASSPRPSISERQLASTGRTHNV